MDINDIINKHFNTDKGYLFLVEMIKENNSTLKINESNLSNLKIETMSREEFASTGFAGIYIAKDNTIKVFTNYDLNGEKIFPDEVIKDYLSDETLINTFAHELIHAMTSKTDAYDNVTEGINIRRANGQNSFFLAINEGITQMITDDLFGKESDAYPFETNFARQLSLIIGKDKLLEIYSSNNPQLLLDAINSIGSDVDALDLLSSMYTFYCLENGFMINDGKNYGDKIQSQLVELYKASGLELDDEFRSLVLDEEKVNKYMSYMPNQFESMSDLGFENINEIKASINSKSK